MQQCDWWNTEKTGKGRPSAAIGCRTREGERTEKRLGMAALASMQIWLTCDPACLPRTDRCLSLTPCLLPPTVSGSTQVTQCRGLALGCTALYQWQGHLGCYQGSHSPKASRITHSRQAETHGEGKSFSPSLNRGPCIFILLCVLKDLVKK